MNGALQFLEYIILFILLVLACGGWGVLACERTKLFAGFGFMLGFAVVALLAYLIFFVFLINVTAGRMVCAVALVGSVDLTVRQFSRSEVRKEWGTADVWLPVILMFLYTASCLLILLLHGGEPRKALTVRLPEDNILPQILADRLWNGGAIRPFYGDWLSSDRPPLQAAMYLFFRPVEFLGFNPDEVYAIVATLCQTVWIPAVFLLARMLGLHRYAIALTLAWFAGNGFFVLQSIYTWPKLFSASLFLAGLAVLLFCAKGLSGKKPGVFLFVGLFWALALLAHGGILFSLLAVPLLPMVWQLARTGPLVAIGAVAVFMTVNLPWLAYQHLYDPPANRLIKMHFAGVIDVDNRSTVQTLRDSYGALTFSQWLRSRWSDVETSACWNDPVKQGAFKSWEGLQDYINDHCFYRITAVLGLAGIGFLVLLAGSWRKRRYEPEFDSFWQQLLWMNLGCYLIWVLLIFRPDQAVVHQGSYAMIILFLMMAMMGLARLPRWAGLLMLSLQWLQFGFADVYSAYVPVPHDAAWMVYQVLYWGVVVVYLAVCGFYSTGWIIAVSRLPREKA